MPTFANIFPSRQQSWELGNIKKLNVDKTTADPFWTVGWLVDILLSHQILIGGITVGVIFHYNPLFCCLLLCCFLWNFILHRQCYHPSANVSSVLIQRPPHPEPQYEWCTYLFVCVCVCVCVCVLLWYANLLDRHAPKQTTFRKNCQNAVINLLGNVM